MTDERAQKVADALLEQPELAFDVVKTLLESKLAGPWVRMGTVWQRWDPTGKLVGNVTEVIEEPRRYFAPRLVRRRCTTLKDAMEAEDRMLRNEGWCLVETTSLYLTPVQEDRPKPGWYWQEQTNRSVLWNQREIVGIVSHGTDGTFTALLLREPFSSATYDEIDEAKERVEEMLRYRGAMSPKDEALLPFFGWEHTKGESRRVSVRNNLLARATQKKDGLWRVILYDSEQMFGFSDPVKDANLHLTRYGAVYRTEHVLWSRAMVKAEHLNQKIGRPWETTGLRDATFRKWGPLDGVRPPGFLAYVRQQHDGLWSCHVGKDEEGDFTTEEIAKNVADDKLRSNGFKLE